MAWRGSGVRVPSAPPKQQATGHVRVLSRGGRHGLWPFIAPSRPRSDVDASAILWMITSLDPAAIPTRLPHGLTVDDARRIAHALDSTHAEAPRRVYAHAWRQWERWCGARHMAALPAAPAMI